MNWVYANGQAAFSEAKAEELGVEGIDLSKGPTIPILADALAQLRDQNYIPPPLVGFVSEEEAASRWEALQAWYDQMGHFMVSNGPYYLERVDPDALQIVVKAFRDVFGVSYLYGPDRWNELVQPKVPDITPELPPIVTVGEEAVFIIRSTLRGTPYSNVKLNYLVVNPLTGEIITSGPAELIAAGTFAVTLPSEITSRLTPGTYEIVLVGVGGEAAIPRVASTTFTVLPSIRAVEERVGRVEERIGEVERTLREQISQQVGAVEERIRAVSESLADAINGLGTTLGAAIDDLRSETRTEIGGLRGEISDVKNTVTTVQSAVNTLSSDVEELRSTVATIQTLLYVVIVLTIVAIVVAIVRRK
jgi:peptide/nickel transport system substrate-binding protein